VGQLENLMGDTDVSERERSGVVFIHTFPKGFNVGRRPTATEQMSGLYHLGVFFIVLTLASSFLQEKKDGTFQRILAAPLSRQPFSSGNSYLIIL